MACLILSTAPKVLVLGLRWAIVLRNSIECPFFWSGYVSGFASPYRVMSVACISTAWPLPTDSTRFPVAAMHAPVVIFFSSSSLKLAVSTTIWMLFIVEPSFRAMNAMFLFPLFVLTQPFAVTSCPGLLFSKSLTFVLISSIFIFLPSGNIKFFCPGGQCLFAQNFLHDVGIVVPSSEFFSSGA